jgi:histidinol dehydrogenase
MKILIQPEWAEIVRELKRPEENLTHIKPAVIEILDRVKNEGDQALFFYGEKFDGKKLTSLAVSREEILKSGNHLSEDLKTAIRVAYRNIETFHKSQLHVEPPVETTPGVWCWRKNVAIDKVGLYIPGGSAPLFSTVLMLGIPAKIAGCPEVILCSPPDIHPAILYAANLCGIEKIFAVGGAQAIGAMAFGTESIPSVYKIFGPGNPYVNEAKKLSGIAIDMPAGPSEVLIFAGKGAQPEFVAADLLSQAEHGPDSQVVLIGLDIALMDSVQKEIERQIEKLPRKEMAKIALQQSVSLVVENEKIAAEIINFYAPEHLILAMDNAREFSENITNAGSVFLGHFTPESAGDYASGTNHTLPTNGYAKAYSGVSMDSFFKKITYQEISKEGLKNLGPSIEILADAETLHGHKNAVTLRLKKI